MWNFNILAIVGKSYTRILVKEKSAWGGFEGCYDWEVFVSRQEGLAQWIIRLTKK